MSEVDGDEDSGGCQDMLGQLLGGNAPDEGAAEAELPFIIAPRVRGPKDL